MAWIEIARRQYVRAGLRYASDLTDGEWVLLEPPMPPPSPIGRPRETDLRVVMDAILSMASTGCPWRQLPKDFPPYSTVQGNFYEWSRDGPFASINHTLVRAARERAGREASPTAGGGSTANRPKPRKAVVRDALTQARRSRGASAISHGSSPPTSEPSHANSLRPDLYAIVLRQTLSRSDKSGHQRSLTTRVH
jgi:transposase